MRDAFVALRDQFPSLEGKVYMVAHSFGPCPQAAFEDLEEYRETLLKRPAMFPKWLERLEEMYGLVAALLGARPEDIALRESASASHATILASLEPTAGRRRLVTTALHFPSILYMTEAQRARGFEIDVVPSTDGIQLDTGAICDRIGPDVAAVLVPVVASFSGALLDAKRLVDAAHAAGAIAVLDAYTALGVVPLDVGRLPPCVVIGGTMKWLGGGGTGLAFMVVHRELVDRLVPRYPAWLGDARFLEFQPTYQPAPFARRYQVGTPAMEPIYTARAGLRFVLEHGVERLAGRNAELLERLASRVAALGLELRSPRNAGSRAGVLAVAVKDAKATVSRLREAGLEIDARSADTVRLGPHWCVSLDECDRAIELLAER